MIDICKKEDCNSEIENLGKRTFLDRCRWSNIYCGKHVREELIKKTIEKQRGRCPVCVKKIEDDFILRIINEDQLRTMNNFVVIHYDCKELMKKFLTQREDKSKNIKLFNPYLIENNFKNNVKGENRFIPFLQPYDKSLTSKLLRLIVMQLNICNICFKNFTLKDSFTIDHIVPKSKGGDNKLSNLQLVHSKCNSKKDDKDMSEFYKELMKKN